MFELIDGLIGDINAQFPLLVEFLQWTASVFLDDRRLFYLLLVFLLSIHSRKIPTREDENNFTDIRHFLGSIGLDGIRDVYSSQLKQLLSVERLQSSLRERADSQNTALASQFSSISKNTLGFFNGAANTLKHQFANTMKVFTVSDESGEPDGKAAWRITGAIICLTLFGIFVVADVMLGIDLAAQLDPAIRLSIDVFFESYGEGDSAFARFIRFLQNTFLAGIVASVVTYFTLGFFIADGLDLTYYIPWKLHKKDTNEQNREADTDVESSDVSNDHGARQPSVESHFSQWKHSREKLKLWSPSLDINAWVIRTSYRVLQFNIILTVLLALGTIPDNQNLDVKLAFPHSLSKVIEIEDLQIVDFDFEGNPIEGKYERQIQQGDSLEAKLRLFARVAQFLTIIPMIYATALLFYGLVSFKLGYALLIGLAWIIVVLIRFCFNVIVSLLGILEPASGLFSVLLSLAFSTLFSSLGLIAGLFLSLLNNVTYFIEYWAAILLGVHSWRWRDKLKMLFGITFALIYEFVRSTSI